MEQEEIKNLLREGALSFDVGLDRSQLERLLVYKNLLLEWNEKINLTAIEEDRDIILKHYVDSISIVPHLPREGGSLIDVGTGAGFPGIPVKVVCDAFDITLLDSLDKRVRFLQEVISQLGLKQIKAVHGRAEDFGVKPGYREVFDVAVARAVANLPVLLEYCLPFVRVGGLFLAMKGNTADEVSSSQKALDILGGKIEAVHEFVLPGSDMRRTIVQVRKLRQTPTKYPRKAGKPAKEPLL